MRAKRARKAESRKKLKRSYWFFEALRFEVDGQLYSLREIERDIIVTKFGDSDARILCCLNKGCVGSPKLSNKPFEAHRLNQQLNEQNRLLCSGAVKKKDLSLIGHNICVSGIFRHSISNMQRRISGSLIPPIDITRSITIMGLCWATFIILQTKR